MAPYGYSWRIDNDGNPVPKVPDVKRLPYYRFNRLESGWTNYADKDPMPMDSERGAKLIAGVMPYTDDMRKPHRKLMLDE